jgi:nucleotide-binding universal stress UspA family protein
MYRRILVPTDGSIVSARAERAAVRVAKRFNAKITAVHVMAPYSPLALGEIRGLGPRPMSADEYKAAAEKRGKALLKRLVARTRRAGLDAATVLVTSDTPSEALVKAANDARCDLIVMGSNSRVGITRIFIGSVASEVLSATRIPTLICH